jgi:hypothetical protein
MWDENIKMTLKGETRESMAWNELVQNGFTYVNRVLVLWFFKGVEFLDLWTTKKFLMNLFALLAI